MMMYLINFVLCSGLLLIVYRLFLQNERMYRFNRFYLLFSLVFSLVVPLVTIAVKTETVPVAYQQAAQQIFEPSVAGPADVAPGVQQTVEAAPNYLPIILMALYGIVSMVLMVRFLFNIYRINREVTKNQVVEHQHTQLVLTDANVTPHSFLKYVFINRNDYNEGSIAPEIICHEQTHVRQLHSLDVMLVELIQAVCWFNPFIPFYRKAIQLNHEFLADEAVIANYEDTPAYQYLLVSRASQAHSLQLTSQFNYLTTKKRLIMMTKTTSAKMARGKKLALVPVLAAALFLFSNKTSAQQTEIRIDEPIPSEIRIDEPLQTEIRIDEPVIKLAPPAAKPAPQSVLDQFTAIIKKYDLPPSPEHFKNGKFVTPGLNLTTPKFTGDENEKLMALYNQMDKTQRGEQWIQFVTGPPPMGKRVPNATQYENFKDATKYGVWIDGKRVDNKKLEEYKPTDFGHYFISNLYGAAKSKIYNQQLDLMTKSYYTEYVKNAIAGQKRYSAWIHIPGKYIPKPHVFPPPIITPKPSTVPPLSKVAPVPEAGKALKPGTPAPPKVEPVPMSGKPEPGASDPAKPEPVPMGEKPKPSASAPAKTEEFSFGPGRAKITADDFPADALPPNVTPGQFRVRFIQPKIKPD